MMLKALAISCLSLFTQTVHAEKEGNRFHQVLSYTPPLNEEVFASWKFGLSSIALQDKIVLVPNGVEQAGFIRGHYVSLPRHVR